MTNTPQDGLFVPEYKLRSPTEDDVRAALIRVFGADRGVVLWAQVCRDTGVTVGRVGQGAAFQDVLKRLSAVGGAAATVALSVEIRRKTFARLTALAARTSSRATPSSTGTDR